jgi:hypothetical protein
MNGLSASSLVIEEHPNRTARTFCNARHLSILHPESFHQTKNPVATDDGIGVR